MSTRLDSPRLANALAAVIDEAMQNMATPDDLKALELRLTIRFGGMLFAGLGSLFIALKAFGHAVIGKPA
jgi:hypothetical protein